MPDEHCELSRKSATVPWRRIMIFTSHAADVADHVGVGEEVQRRGRMGHRLDHADVGADDVLQQVLAVAGQRQRADLLEAGRAHLAEQRLGVLDRVAVRRGVAAEEQLALRGESTTALAVVLPKSQPTSTAPSWAAAVVAVAPAVVGGA